MSKNENEVAVTHNWTWGELAAAIKKCGGDADDKSLEALAEKLKDHLKEYNLLVLLMSNIDMTPAKGVTKSLYNLGVSFPNCGLCERLVNGYCWYYCEQKTRESWNDGLDCFHFATSEEEKTLWYEDVDFTIPIISLTGKFPDAREVVEALRKDPRWAKKLDEVSAMVDDVEKVEKWRLE